MFRLETKIESLACDFLSFVFKKHILVLGLSTIFQVGLLCRFPFHRVGLWQAPRQLRVLRFIIFLEGLWILNVLVNALTLGELPLKYPFSKNDCKRSICHTSLMSILDILDSRILHENPHLLNKQYWNWKTYSNLVQESRLINIMHSIAAIRCNSLGFPIRPIVFFLVILGAPYDSYTKNDTHTHTNH